MAETISIGGKPFPKTGVYAAGAAVAGIVGYAWFTRGKTASDKAAADAVAAQIPEPVDVPTDKTDFSITGGGPPPTTNADWGELAVNRLMTIGLDGPAVSSAVGKFLARKPLNKTDADLVRQAIRAAGYPPQNGPWTVIEEVPGAVVVPPPPPPPRVKIPAPPTSIGLLPLGHMRFGFKWSASAGATKYRYRYLHLAAFKVSAWSADTPALSAERQWQFPNGARIAVEVSAGNAAGWSAPRRSNTVTAR